MKKLVPTYTCDLVITKKKVTFRPLTVKEEKYISQINELSESFSEQLLSLSNLVDSCCDNAISSKDLSIYDFQILLMNIRKKSISETSQMQIRCPYTNETVIVNMNYDDNAINKIQRKQKLELILNNNIKLKLKLPTVADLIETNVDYKSDDDLIKLLPFCLLEIEHESKTVDLTMETDKNKLEVLEVLSRQDYKKVKTIISKGFFTLKLKYQTSDGVSREVVVSDFVNFLKFFLVTLI